MNRLIVPPFQVVLPGDTIDVATSPWGRRARVATNRDHDPLSATGPTRPGPCAPSPRRRSLRAGRAIGRPPSNRLSSVSLVTSNVCRGSSDAVRGLACVRRFVETGSLVRLGLRPEPHPAGVYSWRTDRGPDELPRRTCMHVHALLRDSAAGHNRPVPCRGRFRRSIFSVEAAIQPAVRRGVRREKSQRPDPGRRRREAAAR
jgi:hypothetical protein